MSSETSGKTSNYYTPEGLAHVKAVLRQARDRLDGEVALLVASRPSFTDDVDQIVQATIGSAELAGKRKMLGEIASGLGLTNEAIDATLEQ